MGANVPEYVCAFEITRTFTDEEVAHDPDPAEVMGILIRQVEDALRTLNGPVGTTRFMRLNATVLEGWT